VVAARSSIHDTKTRWESLGGSIEASVDALESATASFTVDMTEFDAGDWLKNRKLRKDLDVKNHPTAEFVLTELKNVTRDPEDANSKFRATAVGTIRWRGRETTVEAIGSGVVTDEKIEATATFDLDVTTLGVKPPKILMFKVEDVVCVEVTLVAHASR